MVVADPGYKLLPKAIHYLCTTTSKNSLWKDFNTLAGSASEWVSCYVLDALLQHPLSLVQWRDCIHRKMLVLNVRDLVRIPKGYNLLVPADADSSAWYLSVLKQLKKDKYRNKIELLSAFLERHQNKDGGYSTFHSTSPIRKFIKAGRNQNLDGWQQSHSCVTPFILLQLNNKSHSSIDFVLRTQEAKGNWRAYWWADSIYATYHTICFLSTFGNLYEPQILKAKAWCKQQFLGQSYIPNFMYPFGSPFATALGIATLLQYQVMDEDMAIATKAVKWLASMQLPMGNWQPSALLRIPPPYCLNASSIDYFEHYKGSHALCKDYSSVFTTATVVRCLATYVKALKDERN